ncbi:MAG: hypothetical protein WA876_10415 [Candidatus Acidiferrales bacterium]
MSSAHSSSPVLDAERRAWSYWFVDGLPNLLAGILCLLLAGTLLLLAYHPHTHSPLVLTFVALAFGIYIVLCARLRETLEWLKARITYIRTGYAAPPYFTENSAPADLVMLNLSGVREKEATTPLLVAEDLRWRLWFLLSIFTAEPLAGRFIPSHLLCAVAGIVAGLLAWWATRKDPRKSWAVVFGLLLAQLYTLNFMGTPHMEGAGYFQAGVGFALALAGAIALIRYLRRNPVARA